MTAREEILRRLKSAVQIANINRPAKPTLSEITMNREQMIQRFQTELAAQTGVLFRAGNQEDARRILTDIIKAEKLKSFIASTDRIHGIHITSLCSENGIPVTFPGDFKDRDTLREATFNADAGITSADFGVAETGTIGIIFNPEHPRLISIAPPVHIAVMSVKNLYPVYENVMEMVFRKTKDMPSQFSFITGPSATADIQGIAFKGMHGPKKIFVIMMMDDDV